MEDYQDYLVIATPEGLELRLVLGGLGSRFSAALIDLLLKAVLIGVIAAVVAIVGGISIIALIIAPPVVYIGYDIAFEVFAGGQTPGKRRTGLRVLRTDGRPVDVLSSAIRNIVRLVDGLALLYVPGMISILLTSRNQRLGDLAGRTVVVREQPVPVTVPEPLVPDRSPTPTAGLDVSGVTPEDLAVLRAFLERRGELESAQRADIARRLAVAIRPRIGGAVAALDDEALIDRVVAAKDV